MPAYYYAYDTSLSGCPVGGDKNDDACYLLVSSDSTTDPWTSAEKQNFANWYSFYRTRNLATVSAATLAFAELGTESRVAWQNLHTCDGFDTDCDGWTNSNFDSRIDQFTGDHRANFYSWLSRMPAEDATPLRSALIRAGQMYGEDRPYEFDPGEGGSETPIYECRQNYSIVMTDGIWNSDTITSIGNADSPASPGLTLPDGTTFTATAPYSDGNSNSLADIAFYYWATDLNTDLNDSDALKYEPVTVNETIEYDDPSNGVGIDATTTLTPVQNPKNDPANWQHMVTFTVGVGLTSTLMEPNLLWEGDTYDGGYKALATGYANWPATGTNETPGNVYDLWHAAINSRGQFFSAETPDDIVAAFNTIIQRIESRQGSASNLSLNAGSVSSSSQFFQALFDSEDWSGHLLSRPFSDGNGNLTCTTEPRGATCPPVWDAACALTGGACDATGASTSGQDWDTEREILTYNGTQGVPFRWTNNPNDLTVAQKLQPRLAFVRRAAAL